MFWRVAGLSTTSPVESVLDKDAYTLEELLDEDEIIQECKALNSRLINFMRGKPQVQALLRYVVEEPPENADNKRAFKFPFIACEIFTCEIDVIFKTLVEDEELMNYLFSFLESDRPHGTLLAGYFSKVVICLLLRKTVPVMRYLQAHQEVLKKLVDLIGITSIMEVLVRLVGADEHIYAFHVDSLQWLADTDLLEMLVDKLSPPNSSEVHANAAETLSAVTRIAPSALASKLSSPKFVGRLFHHVLEDPESKSTLVSSLSVCISLLDPKRAASVAAAGAARGQHVTEPVTTANPETVEGMLQRLGDLLAVLDVSTDEKMLPTTYGRLQPPLGIHRLKIVEFIAVLLRANSEGARHELVNSGAIQLVLKLFYDYPFNNMLHHHVESIVTSCLESNDQKLIDHLFQDCTFLDKLLAADENPYAPDSLAEPKPAVSKSLTRIGNMGHLTRLANRINQASTLNATIQGHLQANPKWSEWVSKVLLQRNAIENVFQWSCGRPTAVQDRPVDSDEDDFRDRDYDISTMASNINREVYRYGMFDNDDAEEGHGAMERDEEDMFFDDESAEVVISSLRLGEDQDSGRADSMFGPNSNWFAFQDDFTRSTEDSTPTFLISSSRNEEGSATNVVSPPNSSGDSSSDDEVVLGEDEDLVDTASSAGHIAKSNAKFESHLVNGLEYDGKGNPEYLSLDDTELSSKLEKVDLSDDQSLFQQRQEGPGAEHVEAAVSANVEMKTESLHSEPVLGHAINLMTGEEIEGVEPDGTIKAMEKMLKEGVVGEAEPLFHDEHLGSETKESQTKDPGSGNSDFNDVNYWRSDYSPSVGEEIEGVEPDGTIKAMEKMLKEGVVGEAEPLFHDEHLGSETKESQTKDPGSGNSDFNDVNYWRSDYSPSVGEEIEGVEPDGTIKAMEKMLKEGVVGEAEPLFHDEHLGSETKESQTKDPGSGNSDFNDVNYWRSDYSPSVGEEIEGVEPDGTIKAMEKMLKEGVVGEAEPLFHDEHLGSETKESQTKDPGSGNSDFNDVNYWRSDYSPSVGEEIEGVEPDGTIKAMEKMLKEGVVGEAEPLFHDEHLGSETKESQTKDPGSGNSDFNDVNYWRSDYSPSVGEEIEGVEPDGTIKAMEKMLKEGVVGEAEPLFHDEHLGSETKESQTKDPGSGNSDFNDVNYWRSDYSPSVGEEIEGVEPDGTIKAMEKMLKEGVVGEAEPLFHDEHLGSETKESQTKDPGSGNSDFNDVNYWRSDYSPSVGEEQL